MENLSALTINYNTETMIFENSDEAKTFLEKFYYRMPCFVSLLEKQIPINLIIQPVGNKLSFIWIFKDRESYIKFVDELKTTKFFNITGQLGWKITHMGSSLL